MGIDNSQGLYENPDDITLPEYDVITPADAPTPDYPVGKTWKVLARGVDGRFREVVADNQDEYMHALALVEAYTTPGEDMPGFIPDAVVIRDGASVHLLRALEAILEWADNSGSTGDILDDARKAVAMAIDPRLDVGDKPEGSITMADIREAGEAGAQAWVDGKMRSDNPFPDSHPLWLHWDRGWEIEDIKIEDDDDAASGESD